MFCLCFVCVVSTLCVHSPFRDQMRASEHPKWESQRYMGYHAGAKNGLIITEPSLLSPHQPFFFFTSQHENFLLTLQCLLNCCFFPAEDPSFEPPFPRVCRHCLKFCFVAVLSYDPFLPLCGTWRPHFGSGLFPTILSHLSVGHGGFGNDLVDASA